MRLEQKKGPFSKGSSFQVGKVLTNEYVHIGIQIPKVQPIEFINNESVTPDIKIQSNNREESFRINKKGILEFDGKLGNSLTITFLKDFPMETVIDLVYDIEGE